MPSKVDSPHIDIYSCCEKGYKCMMPSPAHARDTVCMQLNWIVELDSKFTFLHGGQIHGKALLHAIWGS